MLVITSIVGLVLFVFFVYGLYLSFKAHIILGIVCLLAFPLATVTGLFKVFGGFNLAEWIVSRFEEETRA
jgi:hypothetical protein